MDKVISFKNLIVWQRAMDLVVDIYNILKELPKTEQYCLCDQMRRCAISIPSNIAEGNARHYSKDYYRFLSIAYASSAELETQIYLCERLNYLKHQQIEKCLIQISEIQKMIFTIQKKLIS